MNSQSMNLFFRLFNAAIAFIKTHKRLAMMSYIGIIPFFGCVPTKPPIAVGQNYSEDLSQYRPKFAPPTIEVTENSRPATGTNKPESFNLAIKNNIDPVLEVKMAQILEANKDITGFPGFTVLAYSGFDKTEAQDIKKAIEASIDGHEVVLEYDQPNFKVKVGGFLSRAEAYLLHVQIKEEFPESIIIPNIIKRNEIKF